MRRAHDIPSVEFECSAVEKVTDGGGQLTHVRLTLTEEKTTIDVPAGEVDELRFDDAKSSVFVLVYRRALSDLSLADRIAGESLAKAQEEKLEAKPVTEPLEFEEVKPKPVVGDAG